LIFKPPAELSEVLFVFKFEKRSRADSMEISGAKIVIETLIEQGCDTVFGFPVVRF